MVIRQSHTLSQHAATPAVSVLHSNSITSTALMFLRDIEQPAGQPARVLASRSLYLREVRKSQAWGARPLRAGAADTFTVTALGGQVLQSYTADGDSRLRLSDAAGRPLWARNPAGMVTRWRYEVFPLPGRLLTISEQTGAGSRVYEQLEYGGAEAAQVNLAGQMINHYDNAGTSSLYSAAITGVVRQTRRRLLAAGAPPVDWSQDNADFTEQILTTTLTTDATGAVLQATDAAGCTLYSRYDIAGAMSGAELAVAGKLTRQSTLQEINRDASGNVLAQTAGVSGVRTRFQRDPLTLRLIRHTLEQQGGTPSVLWDLWYDYDPAGNVVRTEDRSVARSWHGGREVRAVKTFAYDSLSRLQRVTGRERQPEAPRIYPFSATGSDGVWQPYQEDYRYDDGGNLLQTSHMGKTSWTRQIAVSERSNRALQYEEGSAPVTEVIESQFLPGGWQKCLSDGRPLSWYANGQLSSVEPVVRQQQESDRESYQWSDVGTRARKISTRAVSGGSQVSSVTYAVGIEQRQTVNPANALTLDIVISDSGTCRVIQDRLTGEAWLRFSFDDHHAGVICETGPAGTVEYQEEFYPYGGSAGLVVDAPQEITRRVRRYSGKEQDATGLYYYGWRYYQPAVGRWLSADPGGLIDGMNLFRFARNNPVQWQDSDGLAPELPASVSDRKKAVALAAINHAIAPMYNAAGDIRNKLDVGTGALLNYLRDHFHSVPADNQNPFKRGDADKFYKKHNEYFIDTLAEKYWAYAAPRDEERQRLREEERAIRREERRLAALRPPQPGPSRVATVAVPRPQPKPVTDAGPFVAWALESHNIQHNPNKYFNGRGVAADLAKLMDGDEVIKGRMWSKRLTSEGGGSGIISSLKEMDGYSYGQIANRLNSAIIDAEYSIGNTLYRGVSDFEAGLWMGAGEGNTFSPARFSAFSFNERRAANFGSGWIIESDSTRGLEVPNYYPGRHEEEFLTSRSATFTINRIDKAAKRIFVSQR